MGSLKCSPGQGNPRGFVVMLYVGEGSEREQCCLLRSLPVFSHFPHYPQANWALLVLIPWWVVCVCSRTLCVSLMNSPVSLGVSPTASTPTGVFNQRLWGFISLHWNPGLFEVCLAPQLFLLVYLHENVGPPFPPAAALPRVFSAQQPISAPPTSLSECFFFNSLVVGLPYSSIFC